jgi:hypothetical protein
MIHFRATANPVDDIEKALLWLREKKQPITRKNVAKVTPYTELQIAHHLADRQDLKMLFRQLQSVE